MASYERRLEPHTSEIPGLIDWIEACCREVGLLDDFRLKIALAVEEAVMNAIDHGFAGLPPPHLIAVRLDLTEQSVTAEIIDNGHAYDPTTAPEPDLTLPLEQRQPGGLGVHLMRAMMDRLDYRRSDGHNILRMEKARR